MSRNWFVQPPHFISAVQTPCLNRNMHSTMFGAVTNTQLHMHCVMHAQTDNLCTHTITIVHRCLKQMPTPRATWRVTPRHPASQQPYAGSFHSVRPTSQPRNICPQLSSSLPLLLAFVLTRTTTTCTQLANTVIKHSVRLLRKHIVVCVQMQTLLACFHSSIWFHTRSICSPILLIHSLSRPKHQMQNGKCQRARASRSDLRTLTVKSERRMHPSL